MSLEAWRASQNILGRLLSGENMWMFIAVQNLFHRASFRLRVPTSGSSRWKITSRVLTVTPRSAGTTILIACKRANFWYIKAVLRLVQSMSIQTWPDTVTDTANPNRTRSAWIMWLASSSCGQDIVCGVLVGLMITTTSDTGAILRLMIHSFHSDSLHRLPNDTCHY